MSLRVCSITRSLACLLFRVMRAHKQVFIQSIDRLLFFYLSDASCFPTILLKENGQSPKAIQIIKCVSYNFGSKCVYIYVCVCVCACLCIAFLSVCISVTDKHEPPAWACLSCQAPLIWFFEICLTTQVVTRSPPNSELVYSLMLFHSD